MVPRERSVRRRRRRRHRRRSCSISSSSSSSSSDSGPSALRPGVPARRPRCAGAAFFSHEGLEIQSEKRKEKTRIEEKNASLRGKENKEKNKKIASSHYFRRKEKNESIASSNRSLYHSS